MVEGFTPQNGSHLLAGCQPGCVHLTRYVWRFATRANVMDGYRQGHPEYCEHFVTEGTGIRLAFTPYPKGKKTLHDEPIDPNNWKDDPFAHDFMPHHIIEIPFVDYEITQDGGNSWMRFWHYENVRNYYPECDSFDSLDTDNFCVWTWSHVAITHDGGGNWIIRDSNAFIQDYSGCQG